VPAWLDRWLRPREGWLSLVLLFVMLLALSWSTQSAKWLPRLEFLAAVAFFGVLLGAILGLSRLSVVFTLPIAALAGTGIVLWTIGGEYFTALGQIGRLLALRTETIDWFRTVVERGYPPQVVPYAIGLGILMWVTAFIAAYTIYRHHRVMDAILLVGATLIANMTATITDLIGYLVLFVLAALLLWLRGSLVTREESWVRRRVTENLEVPAAIMRSGILFIAVSITLAWTLTSVAHAAPLEGVWNNLDGVWNNVRDGLAGYFSPLGGGNTRFSGPVFGNSFVISNQWNSADSSVMTVYADHPQYMRATIYDIYTGHGWDQSPSSTRRVAPQDPFFADDVPTPERPDLANLDAFVPTAVRVHIDGSLGGNVFTPIGTFGAFPDSARLPVIVRQLDAGPYLAGIQASGSLPKGKEYDTGSYVSNATAAQLAAAGTVYPPGNFIATYLQLPASVTEQTRSLALQVVDAAGAKTPYAMAQALADYLRSSSNGLTYSTKTTLPDDPKQDVVDYFLFTSQSGFCEYYASAMVVMARSLGIPARLAEGYTPGESSGPHTYVIQAKDAHAWAEIYFPGYGWQIFEATKSIPSAVRLRGVAQPSPTGGPVPSFTGIPHGVEELPSAVGSINPVPGGFGPGEQPPATGAQGGNILIISFLALLVLAVALWRLRRLRRSWRFLPPGDRQWQRLAAAAGRAGISQRPTETYYEYAEWLEQQIPARSVEIRTIAEGKVWESYSGRTMTRTVISAIERAWKRLELPLVWLTVRRRLRALWPQRSR
jgi:transglutaminase-like putative cysteine protease